MKPRIFIKRYSSGLYWCVSPRPVPYKRQTRIDRHQWDLAYAFAQQLNRKIRNV